MNKQVKFLAVAAATLLAGSVYAQSAGTWMARIGATKIAPDVTSGCLTPPDFGDPPAGCSKSDVGPSTKLAGGITYMVTDNISVDIPLALPFKHKIIGAGALAGAGDIGEVQALPMTTFLQYRLMAADAKFRPYLGLGVTYAYFFKEEGSGRLTATTNPGGPPTKLSVDSKWALTPQIGATLALTDRMFLDVSYSKTKLSTTTHMSTGQTMDINLDPATYSIAIGCHF